MGFHWVEMEILPSEFMHLRCDVGVEQRDQGVLFAKVDSEEWDFIICGGLKTNI